MKLIPALLLLGLTLSLCNLMKSKNSNSPLGAGTGSSADSVTAEKAVPTAAQTAALAGGQTVKWDQQGMSWTLPPKWTKVTDDRDSFAARSPGGFDAANLIVSISTMGENFPTDVSLKATYDGQKTRMKNGELDELRWLEIDGVKGVQFRESNPEKPDGFRRTQWITFRKYAGQVQQVNIIISTDGKDYPRHQDAIYGVLFSTKLVH
ncbi:MAG: hypothetical protein JWM21_623 [Acidobacteria bacterium]|nr:hypothetical protein [Acidobacteriota bacterium]